MTDNEYNATKEIKNMLVAKGFKNVKIENLGYGDEVTLDGKLTSELMDTIEELAEDNCCDARFDESCERAAISVEDCSGRGYGQC